MGFSIYVSLPVIFQRNRSQTTTRLLVAIAIGILIFLLADVFADVATYSGGTLRGYRSSFSYDVVLPVELAVGFLALYFFDNRSKTALTPTQLSLIIALGIGFQNLTEGLSLWEPGRLPWFRARFPSQSDMTGSAPLPRQFRIGLSLMWR